MTELRDELHDLLLEVRRLKVWLIVAAVLLSIALGYTLALSRSVTRLEQGQIWQVDKTAQIKAAYEEQKKDLYKLDERFTEAEVQRRVGLIMKEKDDD